MCHCTTEKIISRFNDVRLNEFLSHFSGGGGYGGGGGGFKGKILDEFVLLCPI